MIYFNFYTCLRVFDFIFWRYTCENQLKMLDNFVITLIASVKIFDVKCGARTYIVLTI